jgi:ABC-type dipeptide/oligopeptide/nickel transport system permease subunit
VSALARQSLRTIRRAEVRPLRFVAALGLEIMLGTAILGIFVLVAVAAPLLAPYDPHAFSGQPLERPSRTHPLGTNDAGQDILSELIYGARISLAIGLGAALGTVALSLLVGGVAGYTGGTLDAFLMRLVDVMLTLPRLPLLILLAAFLGSGPVQTMAIISLLFWPVTARVIRAEVQSLRRRGHVRMARNFGGSAAYVLRRHILPAIAPLIAFGLVAAAGRAVAMEAGLAFLGLGDPTAKSWGLMMRFALNLPGLLLTDRWLWWLLPPGVCITLLILALTYVGMGLEGRLHPGLRRR